jgi:hypothetical protein
MMDLLPETLDLLQTAIYSGAIVFLGMLLVNGVSDLVQRLFGGGE